MQFHWIYVLIAGVIILLLFYTIAGRIKTASDVSYCNSIATQIRDEIRNSNYKQNSLIKFDIKTSEDIYYDGNSIYCKGSIGAGTNKYIIFGNNITKSGIKKSIVVLTLPYYNPFFITNVNYYFDTDNKIVLDQKLYDSLVTNYLLDIFKEPSSQATIKEIFKLPSTTPTILSKAYCFHNQTEGTRFSIADKCSSKPINEKNKIKALGIISSNTIANTENLKKLNAKETTVKKVILNKCVKIRHILNTTTAGSLPCYVKYNDLCKEINKTTASYNPQNIDIKNYDLVLGSCMHLY